MDNGRVIEGKWLNSDQNKRNFIFQLSLNYDQFSGKYSMGNEQISDNDLNNWNGVKIMKKYMKK